MVNYMYYLKNFFIYSIIGFLLETIVSLILGNNFNSGILYGPWTPIYGIGTVLVLLLSKYLFLELHMPRYLETIICFLSITSILTFLEWLGGVSIELIFDITFWDYSNHKYHLGKFVSPIMSLIWGFSAIIMIYFIKPLTDKFIKKIPNWTIIIMSLLLIVDTYFTLVNKI